MKKYFIYISLFTAVILAACNSGSGTTSTPSSDPTISSLTFGAQDSLPGLAKAVFTIEERTDTGLIYNVDSILFGTRINKVVPAFRFNHTPASATIYTPSQTISLTGTDTIDFSERPMYIKVIAEDLSATKWYAIEVNVHQVDPDLYNWEKLSDNIYPTDGAGQQLVIIQDLLCIYVNYGTHNVAFVSEDGVKWKEHTVKGLPDNCDVRAILNTPDSLWYVDEKNVYTSVDGENWQTTDISAESYSMVSTLFHFNDSTWAIVQDDATGKYILATAQSASQWVLHDTLPDNFPVSDFATTTFLSATNRRRAMVMGGFSAKGESLNTRWNVEFVPGQGYRWLNFSIAQPGFQELTGVALIAYADRFFLFGGVNANNQTGEYQLLESTDEGINWSVPDTLHNQLPASYTPRTKPSVAVDSRQNIYLVGGQSRTQVFSDIYRGRLNSIDW